MAWFHCRVPLHDSSGSDRDPMESVGLASQAGCVCPAPVMNLVFGLLLLTAEPRTGGGAAGGDHYIVLGIENLDC